ncbi:unnamed protein product [Cyprideis torosa]|uniref:Uncharacterized protein n=1 Tax=Cyprideis torosa TaxID=163714 RepID=A0A7R8ZJF9_9CRUS|nr:unnamed protein product [Cyprideis torosa]CAG0886883.1 unnamed protein product [Cyprideis torosa]
MAPKLLLVVLTVCLCERVFGTVLQLTPEFDELRARQNWKSHLSPFLLPHFLASSQASNESASPSLEIFLRAQHPNIEYIPNETCKKHFQVYFAEAGKPNVPPWALKMMDSTAVGVPSGMLSNNVWHVGMFSECLSVEADRLEGDGTFPANFLGKYCFVREAYKAEYTPPEFPNDLNDPTALQMRLIAPLLAGGANIFRGVCVPSSCSENDLITAWERTAVDYELAGLDISTYGSCSTSEALEYNRSEISFLTVVAITLALCLAGTAIDLHLRAANKNPKNMGKAVRSVLAFSFYTNLERLMATNVTADNIGCLNGIRVLSMMWIITGHVYQQIPALGSSDIFREYEYWDEFITRSLVSSSVLAVDSFLFMSGFLVTYASMKELRKRKGKINMFLFYFHRYVRLTPVVLMHTWFLATSYIRTGSGPFWNVVAEEQRKLCEDQFWEIPLYIQNIVTPMPMCNGITWYITVDMQLYLITPIILFPLYHFPLAGLIGLVLAILGSIFLRLGLLYYHDVLSIYLWQTLYNSDKLGFEEVYITPWGRASPYLIGMLVSVLFQEAKSRKLKLTKARRQHNSGKTVQVIVGWGVTLATFLTLLTILHPWGGQHDPEIPVHFGRLYSAFYTSIWALGLGWMVIACSFGYGGPLNSFLSWSLFVPLGRLIYAAYLFHILVFFWYNHSLKHIHDNTDERNVFIAFGVATLTMLIALVASLLFESPIMNLEKIFLAPPEQRPKFIGAGAPIPPSNPGNLSMDEMNAMDRGDRDTGRDHSWRLLLCGCSSSLKEPGSTIWLKLAEFRCALISRDVLGPGYDVWASVEWVGIHPVSQVSNFFGSGNNIITKFDRKCLMKWTPFERPETDFLALNERRILRDEE